ncbi:SDR family NAD(P)-dependent oxidoreductase [Streptomyces sp. 6N223]|uniref:SDR family NAD(P)-dependent oxidoreductase n=1 Tax=Streptomyces sp. 6N223 TaxID=3457412 RepID=UPI003FD0B804
MGSDDGAEQPPGQSVTEVTAVTAAELAAFDRTVAKLRALDPDDPVRLRAEQVAASFARDGRLRRRKTRHQRRTDADAAVTAATATGAPARREDAPLRAPGTPGVFARPRRCYVCKEPYRAADAFYHRLCPACAADSAARRAQRTDLRGRRALLTGGRVKIGFQLALMMLRDGAELLVTTRFPQDALRRFRAAPGSEAWLDRLTVVAIDLRDPRQVLGLCDRLREEGRPLDILVNNAAQTVRRPPESYALLAAGETAGEIGGDVPGAGAVLPAPGFRPTRPNAHAHADGALALVLARPVADAAEAADADEAGLLPDPAPANSWSARLGELDPVELLETQLVNALAPALLCDRILPLLLASPHPRRYVVNVTAVEGRFAVRNKTAGHPHTNMAKAALNMLTRTSGPELGGHGVYMCSVDTGWITDENPLPKRARLARDGFRTPLDVVDGAARVYDPIVRGEAGAPVAGVFLKDYREAAW